MAGCTTGAISPGRLGLVLVDVVVVVKRSDTIVVDVVVVDVDVVVVDSVAGRAGHDCVATVGTLRTGVAGPALIVVETTTSFSSLLVLVGWAVVTGGATTVLVTVGRVSKVTSARESAGATAGASLWVQVSS